MKKILIITGDISADNHASGVIKELKKNLLDIEIFGTGGQALRECGVKILYDIKELTLIGISEIFRRYSFLKQVFQTLSQKLETEKPDLVILCDYSGFNLRFAKVASEKGFTVVYYISPQIWASRPSRAYSIKKYVDHLIVLFAFEVDFYRRYGVKAHFFGHPLLDLIKVTKSRLQFLNETNIPSNKKIISLLCGNRTGEIQRNIPFILEIIEKIRQTRDDIHFILPIHPAVFEQITDQVKPARDISFVVDDIVHVFAFSDAALIKSGTSTLEAAILQTPMIIYYQTSRLNYMIGKYLFRVKRIGLPNVLMGKDIVEEKIAPCLDSQEASRDLLILLDNKEKRTFIKKELAEIPSLLSPKNSYALIAQFLTELLENKKNES